MLLFQRSIDLSWQPGGTIWDQMTVTGYVIYWYEIKEEVESSSPFQSYQSSQSLPSKSQSQSQSLHGQHSMTVGNITTTTVRSLKPNTQYTFGISGLTEHLPHDSRIHFDLDSYGRRRRRQQSDYKDDYNEYMGYYDQDDDTNPNNNNLLQEGGLEGESEYILGHTLAHDVQFHIFHANLTQNHGAIHKNQSQSSSTLGPTGIYGGEGHYGLVLVGDANLEHCNSSSYCCDAYEHDEFGGGVDVCKKESFMCRGTTASFEQYQSQSQQQSNDISQNYFSSSSSFLPGIGKIIQKYGEWKTQQQVLSPSLPLCGPALRLTGSNAQLRGSAWYPRQQDVAEGFDTQFTFRLSNPSFR